MKKIVNKLTDILPIVIEFQETFGFEDFDYGFLIQSNKWECSFFRKEDDIEPSLYFIEDSVEELISKLLNYSTQK